MKLMILEKKDSWGMHKAKVYEESLELVQAIKEEDPEHIAEEALDNIQVAIGILDKLQNEEIDIQDSIYRHNRKLADRGWKHKAVIKIQLNNR